LCLFAFLPTSHLLPAFLRPLPQLTRLTITNPLPCPTARPHGQMSQRLAANAKLSSPMTAAPGAVQRPGDAPAEWPSAAERRHAAKVLAAELARHPAFFHLTVPSGPGDTEVAGAVRHTAQVLKQLCPAAIIEGL
jgi:hypothetical protein